MFEFERKFQRKLSTSFSLTFNLRLYSKSDSNYYLKLN